MRKEVKTYIKAADILKEGDNILTPRLTVVEINSVTKSTDTTGRNYVYVITKGLSPTCYCFLNDEVVLVVEILG